MIARMFSKIKRRFAHSAGLLPDPGGRSGQAGDEQRTLFVTVGGRTYLMMI